MKTIEEKSSVNLRIPSALKEQARSLGLNLSKTLEEALKSEIHSLEREAWLKENQQAIEAYNRRIESKGPALSPYRNF